MIQDNEYIQLISQLKDKIRSTQIKAAIAVNSVLIEFYWELGKVINEKENLWGSKLIEQIAHDLKSEFPAMKGLSRSNLFYAKKFYQFYNDNKLVQQDVGLNIFYLNQIPWGHNILIFSKSNNIDEAKFYIEQTIENNWSRNILDLQIKSNLYKRQGKSITNFKNTLPAPFSELAEQTLKDPYVFDFLTLTTKAKERDVEKQLIQHITKFLLELGKGFAFIGNQYHLEVADEDYYIDLLFYHVHLKCYVVIELKNTKFIPEYAGKLNFYLSAVDDLIKKDDDKPTIGILLCKDKNNLGVEYALRDINKPIGVSEFKFIETLPQEIESSLPTIEEIEQELKGIHDDTN